MIAAARDTRRSWIDALPSLKGRLTRNADLSRITWFRVGGPAEVMFRPADLADLQAFLGAKPDDVPLTVIGVGSNLLVRDGGVPGVTIRLGKGFMNIAIEGTLIRAGAATPDLYVARAARDAGLGGLEFLCGVPGTVGGALRMNAGAYGSEISDVLRRAWAVDTTGTLRELTSAAMGLSYRHCDVPDSWIFTEAELEGRPSEPARINARMTEIVDDRADSQPIRSRTGGSTFANPPGEKAWRLIEAAGCRGLRIGGAMVSEQHCNFLINTGTATAADIEELGEEVRRRVRDNSGIELRWEIRRIGIQGGEVGR
ncbi:MAG: UDP-N-acetylmuramate dehydrogenase [Rhodospirillales bacterium]|nr:MAG: UDP-N-acetylmuramate dehydrogenase [Rhodospirillales bacterium]